MGSISVADAVQIFEDQYAGAWGNPKKALGWDRLTLKEERQLIKAGKALLDRMPTVEARRQLVLEIGDVLLESPSRPINYVEGARSRDIMLALAKYETELLAKPKAGAGGFSPRAWLHR